MFGNPAEWLLSEAIGQWGGALCRKPVRTAFPAKNLRAELELFVSTPTPALPH